MKRLAILASLVVLLMLSATAASAATQQPVTGTQQAPRAPQINMARLAVGGWEHACAGAANGTLMCWGLNGYGEIGDGTTTVRPYPVYVPGLTGVTAIAAGYAHTCAVTTTGGVKCWGRNSDGQLGDGTTTQRLAPVNVQNLASGASAVDTGHEHSCALMTTGEIKCWGHNYNGQLGNMTKNNSSVPVNVFLDWKQLFIPFVKR